MKHDKVFVRHKNFYEGQPYTRDREVKKPTGDKKKYAEKSNKVREAVRQIIDSYEPLEELENNQCPFYEKFPKFFNTVCTPPEKDHNELLNEYVIFNVKKYLESISNPRKENQQTHSSSDPDWNSDDEIEGNMESRKIDTAVIEKVVEKMGDHALKKHQILKRHEKDFLEDYFRTKRLQEQGKIDAQILNQSKNAVQQENLVKKTNSPKEVKETQAFKEEWDKVQGKPKNIWSEYQEKQVNSFVDMGFMTKIQGNQEEIEAELADDNDMFCEEDEEELAKMKEEGEKSQSDSDGDDDIFGDQGPATTVKASKANSEPKIESQKGLGQGTVVINTRVFSKIAEQVGLNAARCNWIISNQKEKYKVSSDYMDIYYRKEKINEILPYISLNHSEFVRNEDSESHSALDIFRKYNSRRDKKYQYGQQVRAKNQYKQKANSHLYKK